MGGFCFLSVEVDDTAAAAAAAAAASWLAVAWSAESELAAKSVRPGCKVFVVEGAPVGAGSPRLANICASALYEGSGIEWRTLVVAVVVELEARCLLMLAV